MTSRADGSCSALRESLAMRLVMIMGTTQTGKSEEFYRADQIVPGYTIYRRHTQQI